MKAVIHTFYTKDPIWNMLGSASAKLAKSWAERHGYKHRVHTQRRMTQAASITWEKIGILKNSINNNPDDEWHVYIDADMYVTNEDLALEQILPDLDHAFYLGSDWVFPLNTGFIALNKKSLPLLESLLLLQKSNAYGYFEQGTLKVILDASSKWEKEVVVMDHNVCNSYPPNFKEKWIGSWRPNDFVVHFAGWKKEEVLLTLSPIFGDNFQKKLNDLLKHNKETIKSTMNG